jgi:hypothetical protein
MGNEINLFHQNNGLNLAENQQGNNNININYNRINIISENNLINED